MNRDVHQTIDLPVVRPSRSGWVMAVMLLLIGGAFVWAGEQVMVRQYVDVGGKMVSSVGIGIGVKRTTRWKMDLHGVEAIRHGAGMAAGGAMLMIWGLACAVATARADAMILYPGFMRALGWLSFGCLVLAAGCFYPPWRWGSLVFWAVVLLFTGCLAIRIKRKRFGAVGFVFMGAVAAALVGSEFDPTFGVKVLLGIFAWIFALGHWFVLRWMPAWLLEKVERGNVGEG